MNHFEAMSDELDELQEADQVYMHDQDDLIVDSKLMDYVLTEMDLSESDVHLNLHGNSSTLAMNIFRQFPDVHVLEIQPNKFICEHMSNVCKQNDIPHTVVGRQSYVQKGENIIQRKYGIENTMAPIVLANQDPQIWFIQDHVRSARVLSQFLAAQKVDSATLVFLAKTLTDVRESPYECQLGGQIEVHEFINRGQAVLNRTTDRALEIASKLVREEGRLLMAGLFPLEDRSPGDADYKNVLVDIGTHTKYWKEDPSENGAVLRSPPSFEDKQATIFSLLHS